jgi:hypothetical protein
MAIRTVRFGVRNTQDARSSEWVVMWKTNTSDVYLATRTLGKSMKASLHASGRCHVRPPDQKSWLGSAAPPDFLDTWDIDTASDYKFPFSVVVPEPELRISDWAQHRNKGTVWIDAPRGEGIEIAVMLARATGDLTDKLNSAGWYVHLVDVVLPDGRRLLVVAGHTTVPPDKLAELNKAKQAVRAAMAKNSISIRNARMLLLAGPNELGTRKFVEAAVF